MRPGPQARGGPAWSPVVQSPEHYEFARFTDELGFVHEFEHDALPESRLGPPWGPRAARSGLAADLAPLYEAHNALPY
jgi:hypothetical protein